MAEEATDTQTDVDNQTSDIDLPAAWMDEHEDLSPEDKKVLSKFDTATKAHKAHVELEGYRGRSIALPKDDASDEDKTKRMGEIYTKLGRPEKPEGYKIERATDLPEGLEWSDDNEKAIRKFGHAQGWNQKQMQDAVNHYTQMQKDAFAVIAATSEKTTKEAETAKVKATKEATAALKADPDFGNGNDKTFKANLENARRAYDVYGGDDFVTLMDKMGLNNNPVVIKTFFEIYRENLAEGGLVRAAARKGEEKGSGFLNYDKVE